MAYTTLYRKYRPSEFDDVKGQDHIVTTLKNQIVAGRISHAYLFCGTRGTGKTTVAKIFAKAVNCEHPVNGSPCGECVSCRTIAAGASMDVVEIDAASNNGVENIRQIREEVSYPPTEGRYRVYIIDEAHMLTVGAFNALLKTLEEPPEYVIFILATTDVNKIPVTILSRCQRYDFRRISVDTIVARLTDLLAQEDVEAEERAVRYIAGAADGSMRDALSLTDQCIAFYLGERLTLDMVLEALGAADTEMFSRLLGALTEYDAAQAVRVTDEMIMQGVEPGQFVVDFTWYLRNLILAKTLGSAEDVLDMSAENLARLKEEAERIDEDVIMHYISVFSDLSGQMKYSEQKRVLLEVALIRLCRPAMEEGADMLGERVAFLEKQMERGMVFSSERRSEPGNEKPSEPGERAPEMPKAIPDDIRKVAENWHSVIRGISGPSGVYLSSAVPSLGEDNRLLLVLDEENAYEFLMRGSHVEEIERHISEKVGRHIDVRIQKNDTGRPAAEVYPDLRSLIRMPVDIDDD